MPIQATPSARRWPRQRSRPSAARSSTTVPGDCSAAPATARTAWCRSAARRTSAPAGGRSRRAWRCAPRTPGPPWTATSCPSPGSGRRSCRSASTTRPSSGRRGCGRSTSACCAAPPGSVASTRTRPLPNATSSTCTPTSPLSAPDPRESPRPRPRPGKGRGCCCSTRTPKRAGTCATAPGEWTPPEMQCRPRWPRSSVPETPSSTSTPRSPAGTRTTGWRRSAGTGC